MALVVETGNIVAGANSYVDLSYFNTYLSTNGVTTTATDSQKEIYLKKAITYLEGFRTRFLGKKYKAEQALQWPRLYVVIDGFEVSETTIPTELKDAQCQLAVEQILGNDLFPKPKTSKSEGAVIEKTIGPLTKKFANPGSSNSQVATMSPIVFASVKILLDVLLKSHGSIQTIRL